MFCQGTEVFAGTQALTVSPPSERRHELQVVTSARARVPTIRSSLLIQCPVLHEPTRGDWQRFSTLPPLCSSGSSSFFFLFAAGLILRVCLPITADKSKNSSQIPQNFCLQHSLSFADSGIRWVTTVNCKTVQTGLC